MFNIVTNTDSVFSALHGASGISDQQHDPDIKAGVLHQLLCEVEPQPHRLDRLEGEKGTKLVQKLRLPAVGLAELLLPVCLAVGPEPRVVDEEPLMGPAIRQVSV